VSAEGREDVAWFADWNCDGGLRMLGNKRNGTLCDG